MTNEYLLEICANSVKSCIEAQKGGANRVELCAGIPEGGTTPSYGDIVLARELLNIKLNVIIRPRGGDFLYNDLEHKIMLKDIENAGRLGVDGVVFGCLTPEGDIDMKRNMELIEAAGDMSITFHRAFDMCRDPFNALEKIIELGFDRILTSGQKSKAVEGINLLKELTLKAGDRIIIMPGSGVNAGNIAQLARETGTKEFHLSAREPLESGMLYRNPNLKMGGTAVVINEFEEQVTSAEKIRETIKALYN
ncbi:MAG: copper homeostasis protein CutC [Fermentimonas sp.]|nr:copper homeostasis protein CutC [Fermentimonas sp.]